MHGLDRVGATGGGEFGSDIADVAVHRAVGHMDVLGVGGAHDPVAGEYMAWALKQAGDDAELDCGQRNRPAVKVSPRGDLDRAATGRDGQVPPVPASAPAVPPRGEG